jgi:hypothetical protein
MKQVLVLFLFILSTSLFADPIGLLFQGEGETISGRKFNGKIGLSMDIEELQTAFNTQTDSMLEETVKRAISIHSIYYGDTEEEHNEILKEIFDFYPGNSETSYFWYPMLTDYNLSGRELGSYEFEHMLFIGEEGEEVDYSLPLLTLRCGGQNELAIIHPVVKE